ncbi:MAG: MaoC family dehydratase [Nitrospinaceae bacterium]|jgi:acyl dehydratase|nr:MaoC family dehydratase [Nitrospinaceae bacterium]MBT3434816.1 MaoC family dehydratase [Nitrospinaceae bacterium]MBT5946857.1 MaoC family dehydratase [Nitrospinaceae bacterium]MBT6396127.1 MaoC family dehydratase [Nitrospinaceae bacterium]MBT7856065.1 MaoC family dehydratase [Nitrospinaceae bacterium]
MPLDPAVLKREFPEFEIEVDRSKIREFAMVLGYNDPVHTNVEAAQAAGYSDLLAPPTFTRQFWHENDGNDPMPHLGYDPKRRLHGEQEFEYHKPLVAGMTIRGRNVIISTKEKEGRRGGKMTFVVIETRFTDKTGELVQVARRTLIETAAPPKD